MENPSPRPWPREPEWIVDRRAAPRWRDVRTVLVLAGKEEHLGKTLNLSVGGAAVAVPRGRYRPGEDVVLCVVFETGVRDLRAKLLACRAHGTLFRLAVAWRDLPGTDKRFLEARYGSSTAEGAGRVM